MKLNIKTTLYSLILLSGLTLAASCESDVPIENNIERTVIIYMVADNNLNGYGLTNIYEMQKAFDEQYGAKLLLLHNKRGGSSTLYEIASHNENTISSPIIKTYAEGFDPCLPSSLSSVIADCRAHSNTKEYAIIFWSHATGWLPKGMSPAKIIADPNPDPNSGTQKSSGAQYAFGQTNSNSTQMEISDLAAALPTDIEFEYIYFDACHTGALEVAYELRNSAKYVAGSAGEVLAAGFPYAEGLKYFLTGDIVNAAKIYFDAYNEKTGAYRTATIGVVKSSEMTNVAAALKELVNSYPATTLKSSQQFGRDLGRSADFTDLMWDAKNLVTSSWGGTAAAKFNAALDKAVIYQAATPMLFDDDYYGSVTINTHCGVSIYIPRLNEPQTLEIYKRDYAWAKDTELYKLAQ